MAEAPPCPEREVHTGPPWGHSQETAGQQPVPDLGRGSSRAPVGLIAVGPGRGPRQLHLRRRQWPLRGASSPAWRVLHVQEWPFWDPLMQLSGCSSQPEPRVGSLWMEPVKDAPKDVAVGGQGQQPSWIICPGQRRCLLQGGEAKENTGSFEAERGDRIPWAFWGGQHGLQACPAPAESPASSCREKEGNRQMPWRVGGPLGREQTGRRSPTAAALWCPAGWQDL